MDETDSIKAVVDVLIKGGRTNRMVLAYLKEGYGLTVSNSWLKNFMKKNGIKRNDNTVSTQSIEDAIDCECRGSGRNAGYRTMHEVLRQRYDLAISRDRVARALARLRPRNFPNARARPWERKLVYCPGPNFVWSVDGYDKLGRWGIYIHGGVDQYSRRILWLKAFSSNRQPELVGEYYLETLKQIGCCPEKVYSDHGNENTRISQCQTWFHADAGDTRPAAHHVWTYSIFNVTVESWWRQLRARFGQEWMEHFHQLEKDGLWTGDIVDRWALWTVYLPVINSDLTRAAFDHNNHLIRNQRDRLRPGGRPQDSYTLPEEYGGKQHGLYITEGDIARMRTEMGFDQYQPIFPVPNVVMEEIETWLICNGIVVVRDNVRKVYSQVRRLLMGIVDPV